MEWACPVLFTHIFLSEMHKRCFRKPNKRKQNSNVSAKREEMILRKSTQREVFAQGNLDVLAKF